MMKLPLQTERLYITQLDESMAESVHLNSLDEDNRRFVPDEVFETVHEARNTISKLMGFYSRMDAPLVYAVFLHTGVQIGHVQAVPIEQGWEIGYHIGKDYTGRGYAAEAVSAFLIPIMEHLGISRIYGICRADNAASIKVLKKCGFAPIILNDSNDPARTSNVSSYVYSIIRTSRLLIRPFKPEDWRDLFEYLSQPEVVRFEPYEPFTIDAAKQEAIRRAQNRDFYAVCLDSKLIGNIYLSKRDFDTWELGYVFHCGYWHLGYASEAVRTLLSEAFKKYSAHRVIAMCNPANEQSWRLLERLGFRREGHLKQNIFFNKSDSGIPIWQDTYEYAMLGTEWI